MGNWDNQRLVKGHKFLRWIWILISFVILIFLLGYNWHHTHQAMQQKLLIHAQKAQNRIEQLFANFLQTVYSLPLYEQLLKGCEPQLQSALKDAVFNNPKISGLMVSDKQHNILCSTLYHSTNFIKKDAWRLLIGPLRLERKEKPFFLLQQKIGDFYLSLLFLQSVLEETLKTNLAPYKYLGLYDETDNKILVASTAKNYRLENFHPNFSVKIPLQVLDKVSLIAGMNAAYIQHAFFMSSLIISLLVLILSLLLYCLVHKVVTNRFSLKGNLKFALKNQHFFPLYQPIYNTQLQRFIGAEVLLRWKTREGDIILPDTFISEVEKSELIVPITLQIMGMALADYTRILKPQQPFYLAFNLAACHFMDPHFFDNFIQLLNKNGVMPHQIMLELTERDIINRHVQIFNEKMLYLRGLGFQLAIDDFGTGHANISYLHHFPFNYLKIDRIFVQAIGTGSVTELLIETIISMAKTLNLAIIAEGVEESIQVDYLNDNDVHYQQGWHFAAAMTITKLRQLL